MSRLVRGLGLLAGVAVLAATPSGAQDDGRITLDFEGFAKGEIIASIAHPGSEGSIRVHGTNPGFQRNAAVIFDSADPGPEDRDLGSPHHDFAVTLPSGVTAPGPGEGDGGVRGAACQNDRPLGKVLIVDDDLSPLTDDGLVAEPDDEGRIGAHLVLDFSEIGPVTIHGMAVLDVEEPDAVVRFYDRAFDPEKKARPSRRHLLAHYRVHTENNGVARLFDPDLRNVPDEGCHVTLVRRKRGEPLTPVEGVQSLEIAFSGSGGVARIVYSADSG